MFSRLARFAVVLFVAACGEAPSRLRQPIIQGAPAPAEVEVLAVADTDGDIVCSGTLISPWLFVTAAHCLSTRRVAVLRGNEGDRSVPFAEVWFEPNYSLQPLANDLAVVRLELPAPSEFTPLPLARTPPAVGESVRLVGFGHTEIGPAGDFGHRLQKTVPVTKVGDTTFTYGVGTCEGDSGGPAVVSRDGRDELAGITSTGDGVCGLYGVDTRIDVFAPWILGLIAAVDPPTCARDGRCVDGCPEPDGDCPAAQHPKAGCAAADVGAWPSLLLLALFLRRSSPSRRLRSTP